MRSGFVLTTIVLALALGIIAGASESRLLAGALVIGFVPAIWVVSQALQRLTGRDMWHFRAPYPYRWMREAGETATPRPRVIRESKDEPLDTNDRSTLPLAA
jgi:hypothetical protein